MAVMEDFSAIFRIAGPGLDRDELVVPGSGLSLGRSGDNDFVLGSGEISRRHMRFVWEDGEIYVTDLNSSNGVYVNDQRIRADVPYKLSVGEVLRAGPFTLTLERIISPKRRRTEAPPPAPEPKPEPAPPVAAAPEPEPEPVAEPEPPVAAAPAPEPEPASAPEPEPAPEPEAELKTVPPAAAAEPAPQPEPEPEPEPPPVARPKGRAPKAEEPVLLFTPVTPEETAPVPEPEPEVKTAPPAAAKPQPEPEPEPAPPPRKSAPRAREEAPAESAPYIPPTAAAPAEPLPPIERVPFTVGGVPGRFRPPPTGNGHREEYPLGLPRDASTWMKYLPEIYSEDDFLGRYLLIFEAMMSPSIWALDSFDLYLTPETAPLDWVRWMAGWFDILIVPDLPEDRQRAVLQQVGWIFKRRGTRAGLERMLELYFGVRPEISEDPKQPFTFVVRLALSESRVKLGPEIVDTIIRAHKPAYTAYRLELT